MAITLRTVKGTALTHSELDANFTDITSSMVHSGSISGTTLTLHKSGSSLDIDLSGLDTTVATGSLMTTGSVSNNVLTFTKGDGSTFNLTVDTGSAGGGLSDNFYTANGTISSNRTVTFSNATLSLTGSLNTFQVFSNEIVFPLIPDAGGNSIEVVAIANNGRLFKTGSGALGGGTTSPGGSDGQVQYNNGGSFGGESTFTYNDGNNTLTIEGATNQPSIVLSNAQSVSITNGSQLSEIQTFYSTNEVGTVAFVAEAGFNPSDTPTRLELRTTNDGASSPTTKFQIKNDGKLIANEYGSGTFTGVAAKYLAVDSSGNIIEEDTSGAGSPAGSDTQVQFNDGGSFGGDAGMTYNKTSDTLVVAGTVSGSDLIAQDEVYVKGMATINQPVIGGSKPVVINTTTGQLKQSIQNPLVGNIEKARVTGTLTINESSNPVMNEINGGRILCFPTASNCRLKFGFPAGDEGPTSWEKDFRTTIYNMGCDTTDVADQNYDLQIELVAPNDGGAVFKSYFIGENSAGTSQFEYDTVSPNTGVVYSTVVKSQGMIDLMMDYENRTIVIWGKSVT